ncbi:threonine/serine exporter family protein [Lacticaseibacillus zhaodongensis]|uniref:threonine/serine exporter family protein n=1 Tax=Lacticaseibacillus zhaodongensis TaxID=2668065 RepID=UPI00280C2D5C|nr:threonine/serine exporter family protein [Lacticaseibacillus zhaodongensis]
MWIQYIVGIILSFASSYGFGIITNIPKRTLLPAGYTGAAAWFVYLLVDAHTRGVILPNLLAAVTIGLVANLAAVIVRAPVNVLYIPCLVSLVPGAIIYKSMRAFTLGRDASASHGFVQTLTIAVSLAVGFVIAEAIFSKLRPELKRLANAKIDK